MARSSAIGFETPRPVVAGCAFRPSGELRGPSHSRPGPFLPQIRSGAQTARPDYDVSRPMRPRALPLAVVLLACAGSRQGFLSSPLVGRTVEVAAEDLKGRTVRLDFAAG